jgi:hypothetical protein
MRLQKYLFTAKGIFYAAVGVVPCYVRWIHQQPGLGHSLNFVLLVYCYAAKSSLNTQQRRDSFWEHRQRRKPSAPPRRKRVSLL